MKSNIALIGFMGVGKSTIGSLLARKLNKEYIDLDKEIENQVKSPLAQFVKNNEQDFRNLEKNFCDTLHLYSEKVISCGGGIVLNSDNIKNLRQYTFVVGLESSPGTIIERIMKDGIEKRPVLDPLNPEKSMHQLLKIRNPLYKKASHIMINIDNHNINEILAIIIQNFKKKKNHD